MVGEQKSGHYISLFLVGIDFVLANVHEGKVKWIHLKEVKYVIIHLIKKPFHE